MNLCLPMTSISAGIALAGTHAPIDMEIEIAGDEITRGVIHQSSIGCIKLGDEPQQYIAALDLECLGNLRCGIRGADGGARDPQVSAASEQEVEHRPVEAFGEILQPEH